jgi:hypothetical protein
MMMKPKGLELGAPGMLALIMVVLAVAAVVGALLWLR